MKDLLSKLTWVDYIALVALMRGLYVGYKSGLLQELLRVTSYILSLLIALQFHGLVTQQLTMHTFLNETTAKAVAFGATFLVAFILLKLLRTVLTKVLKLGEGGAMQKVFGALLGGARLLVMLSFFFMFVDWTPLKELKTDVHTRSLTGPTIAQAAPVLYDFSSQILPKLGVAETGKPA